MAHEYTITAATKASGWRITITETGAGASSEVELTPALVGKPIPLRGRIMRVKSARSSGTAANMQPTIGTATNPAGATIAYQADLTAVAVGVDDAPTDGATYELSGTSLFLRSKWDAGSDNAGTTVIEIYPGWGRP